MLLPECLDDFVVESNPVRVIDVFVDALDLAEMNFEGVEPAATGRPSYHPSVLLKLYIYGYLNRVHSSRRLEREAGRNVEVMWLLGRLAPDHKTIADFRKDNGLALRKVCARFVELCREMGLLATASIAIDGSKFQAVNNQLKIHVRLCWRRHRGEGERWYSAAQLRAKLINDDWDKTLQSIEQRDRSKGVSHTLLVQSDDGEIDSAALIPTESLVPIWKGQREVCARLIAEGKLGRIKKNINENGKSPTIYLIDTRTPSAQQIPNVLWNWPGVLDIAKLQIVSEISTIASDDTYDDFDIDLSLLGSDGGPRLVSKKSGVKRDPAVRREVVRRATGGCERSSCSDDRRYVGFLDVHHILGAEKSDRVWTCVALYPNCHRAAHFAPDRDALNEELLQFASQFRPATRT